MKTEEPGNGDYRIALARGYDLRATADGQQGDIESGLADNQRVLEALVEGISRDRVETAFPRFTGPTLYNLSAAGNGTFYLAGNAQSVDRGVWSGLPWKYPLLLGKAWTNQGVLLSLSGRNAEAARVLEQAIVILRLLVEACPRSGLFRHGLAVALLHSGRVRVQLGLPGSAEPALREALGLMQRLIQDDPFVVEYRSTRLLAAGYLGEALFRLGRTADAAGLLREVETEGEEILVGSGRNDGLRGHHARLLHVLGCLEGESGNLDRGLALCRRPSRNWSRPSARRRVTGRCGATGWTTGRPWRGVASSRRDRPRRLDRRAASILAERRKSSGQGARRPGFRGSWPSRPSSWRTCCWMAGRPDEALGLRRCGAACPGEGRASRAGVDGGGGKGTAGA